MINEGQIESRYGRIYFAAEYDKPANGEAEEGYLVYCGFAPWNAPDTRLPRVLRRHLEEQSSSAEHTPPETALESSGGAIAVSLAAALDGAPQRPRSPSAPSFPPIRLYGSEFQKQVWRALLRIPCGHVSSYGEIAAAIERRGAARAVGSAVGSNPLAPLIPCHRVLPSAGGIGNYGGGREKKRRLLELEKAPLAADRKDPLYFFLT